MPLLIRTIAASSALLLMLTLGGSSAFGQDTVTGAFEGMVTHSLTGDPVIGAQAEILNVETGVAITKITDARGRFYQGLLLPGLYRIKISMPGFQTRTIDQWLRIAFPGEVVPVPVTLDPLAAVAATLPPPAASVASVRAEINARDASRSGSFNELVVTLLPLGATALTSTFDELALLLPGVAPAPQTLGGVAGPGVGAGVGTSGQFSANGLRSRANNFTIDGSDNNDEDIGVRRQGFVALTSQPLESVREYQPITLLAPAQFGRNLGAQVNVVSKSGGASTHGSVYGFFNSSQLNASNFFDTTFGDAVSPLRSAAGQPVLLDGRPLTVRNQSGGEDSFTLGKVGGILGGAISPKRTFYFLSAEGERVNATEEANFAVPTIEQRGTFGAGATGFFQNPLTGEPVSAIPASRNGSAIFNLFPFPNNPQGVYGANTFTQVSPAHARGHALSAKIDHNFKIAGRQQSFTSRYNYTNDRRTIPVTGEALFSTLEPRVRAQNLSLFLNGGLNAPGSGSGVFNQLRLSYGRTRLDFREARDREFLIPSQRLPDTPFLLNARSALNTTLPSSRGRANAGPVIFQRLPYVQSVEQELGPLGQVMIAGLSPLGVDVFNFPQRRVNNTYQLADNLTWRAGDHNATFGTDNRRSELNSSLPRNSRALVTYNGGPRFTIGAKGLEPVDPASPLPVILPTDLAAIAAPNGFYLTLAREREDGHINLRYYQFNFFAQDEWRIRSDLSLSFGLRYEYNTPPREINDQIEKTFNDPSLGLAPGLNQFIGGRERIFDPDRNNFAPRVSLAYSPNLFGRDKATVIRGGYGLFYDQILGAVVSQSRNVYPSFLTLNLSGLFAFDRDNALTFFNPAATNIRLPNEKAVPLTVPGTSNLLNPEIPLGYLIDSIDRAFSAELGVTIPSRRLGAPSARHYTLSIEQQLGSGLIISAAYVGTLGRNLLRFTTPNLGLGATVVPTRFDVFNDSEFDLPVSFGRIRRPSRAVPDVGVVNRFEATARSRYDALQLQLRGRLRETLQFQAAYTWSHAIDDVSDVFDLAGASALPQNSLTFAGERSSANFDTRHRLTYLLLHDLSRLGSGRGLRHWLFDRLQLASVGQYQTGQPFTVNSIFDVNLDGNLTDRLNTTTGLIVTGDRRQPLRLVAGNPLTLLAPFGQDGGVARNTFRAGNLLELDLAVFKYFNITGRQELLLRADLFNFINRANFGIPVRFLEAPAFGQAVNTTTPARRVQFSLKYLF
jgi:Carboxypeptidase regulatory-like domain